MLYAEVVVDIAHSDVDKVFDYKIQSNDIYVGSRVVVPFGNRKLDGIVVQIKESSNFEESKIKSILYPLDDLPALSENGLKLAMFVKEKYHIPLALSLRLFIPTEMRSGKVKEKIVKVARLNDSFTPIEIVSKLKKGSTAMANAIGFLKERESCLLRELNEKFGSSSIRNLIGKNFILCEEIHSSRKPYLELANESKNVTLVAQQNNAVKSITESDKQVSLLHGVTGSGKTEVYLAIINQVVSQGKTAIMLVPEIALTPQMLKQLRSRFGEVVSILHSGLSQGERFDEWWRLRNGEAKIAIGARSAIFAPVDNLGVIIIDEEHDGSYDSESSPRYKTIEVALERCKISNCKLILGSATPSIESYYNAQIGKYNLVEMFDRINKREMPFISVVDMRKEIKKGNGSQFSSELKEELNLCLEQKSQAIIFLNRRGYSRQVMCKECGYVAKCNDCDISLNYHKDLGLLKCHYCNATYHMLSNCPSCGSEKLSYGGTGTERVVEDLEKLFPTAKILRMDNDTTSSKEGHFKILDKFSKGEADFLVGTQMVAKGHDFPNCTLVGVLDADMSLYYSDYRSRERTFQLITQVAGRCGRAEKVGKVVLQTYNAENDTIKYVVDYNYKGFYNAERNIRQLTGFSPFGDIVRIMVESDNDEEALQTLKTVYFNVLPVFEDNKEQFIFFNKMKSPVKRLKNKFRYQVLMRIKENNEILIDKIYNQALKENFSNSLVYVEKNPSALI